MDARLDNRVDGARFLAETAVDALEEIDVVARRAARAVGADVALDRDRERGADSLAELAGDAALLAVRIAAQRMQPAEARRLRRLLLRILDCDLPAEHLRPGDAHTLQQLRHQE